MKRNTYRGQMVRYRLTFQQGARKRENNARSQSMALPTTPSIALPNRAFEYKSLQGAIKNPWRLQVSIFREPLVMIPSRMFGPILLCYHFTPDMWIIGNLCATFPQPVPNAMPHMIHVVGNRPILGWRGVFKSMRFLAVIYCPISFQFQLHEFRRIRNSDL